MIVSSPTLKHFHHPQNEPDTHSLLYSALDNYQFAFFAIYLFKFFYLFERVREKEAEREIERERQRKRMGTQGPPATANELQTHAPPCTSADAVTIDGGLVFEAGLPPYNLKPIAAEFYGSKDDPQTRYYIVAVVKKGSGFQLSQLQGRKSCHPGMGWSGWNAPLSILLPSGSLETAAATFFSSSCVPCADHEKFPSLCQLCAGQGADKCACSSREPYFGYSGAFKCLQDGAGDVSFVRHLTVFGKSWIKSQVGNSQAGPDWLLPLEFPYASPRTPSHVCHHGENFGKDKSSSFQLFGSPHGKDLMFTDAAHGFLRTPAKMDSKMYLGYEYFFAIQNLKRGVEGPQTVTVQWCAVGPHERAKCEQWSAVSGGALACTMEETPEDCLAAITKGEADTMSLDGGYMYTAGKCGLVPVLAENYRKTHISVLPLQGYYVVAVVKKSDAALTWNSLRGKKSCHPAVGTSAGWNVPMGLIYNQTGSCQFGDFFSGSCAPGSDPDSRLCALCGGGSEPAHMCAPNSQERYYGSSGALRCLVEKGDVSFMKHTAILQSIEGKNPEAWAKGLKQEDFELLCLDGTRKPVTEAASCHLARVPNHAVVSRKERADYIARILINQQELFGRNGFEYMMFQMFESSPKDLLFSDDTECLSNLQSKTTYEKYLGPQYLAMMVNFRPCLTSALLDACTFHRS
uniref:Inhibitor of carbonic anhydrase n=1 Tax=Jaculus jaculus TaxID=51337 RepID=A0A8C5KHL5_JACJA